MGHARLGVLPKSREWTQVVELLAEGSDVPELAAAVAIAAEDELSSAASDPVIGATIWLLTQLPLVARSDRFAVELTALGFAPGSEQSLLGIITGFSGAIDSQFSRTAGRTDFGELARQAASESLASLVGAQMPELFGPDPNDVRIELAKFATKDRFGRLARDFFARLTRKTLDYYLSRVLADHVGPHRAFTTLRDQSRFRNALELHCREASQIVEQFAGGWFAKSNYQGRLTQAAAQNFSSYALKKVRDELRARRTGDG